jgi:hypothetical protein
MYSPLEENSCTRLLVVSAIYTLPPGATATLLGYVNCPFPIPSEPNELRYAGGGTNVETGQLLLTITSNATGNK